MPNNTVTRRDFIRSGVVLTATIVAACSPLHLGSSPSADLVFTNESIDQADVYATGPDGVAVRLGTVLAGQTNTLTVGQSVLGQGGPVNVSARLLAQSYVPRTGAFSLHAGDRVRVRLPGDERTLVLLP